ncbi:MAG: glycerol-3-phosphate 1-O-acyltransferase PlsY [Candidatus Hydrogenedentota bacterium]
MIGSILTHLGAAVGGYLSGSIPFAYVIARKKLGLDIREHGSGNVGATNMWRVGGARLGFLCFVLDIAKGYVPAALAFRFGGETAAMLSGTCAIVGHVFPIWLKGSGGKGVATAAGAFLAIAPVPFLYAFTTFLVVGPLATRTVSAGSVAGAVILPYVAWSTASRPVAWLSILLGTLVVYKHRGNLSRLYNGTEARIWNGWESSSPNREPGITAESAPVLAEEKR